MHQFDKLGVWLVDAPSGGDSVHSSSKSSIVVDVKANHYLDPLPMDLKDSVLSNLNDSFSLGGDGILRNQNRLYVPNVDNLRSNILV